MNRDLTVGRPQSVLWRFCLPLFGSVIFQQLYNLADSFVAGNFIGQNALAAVGNSYEITLIFLAFGFGCNIGCSVIVSRLYGAKQYKEMKTAVYTTFICSGVLCAVLMLVGLLLGQPMLHMIQTPDEIFADSWLYLEIYIWGLPFVIFYNVATGIFSALGDSRTPFIFLACSSTANVAVDILFVQSFGMGVDGVAIATFICQGISCILAMIFVFRRLASVKTEGHVPVFSTKLMRSIAIIAIPSILQQSFISVGNIIIQSVVNGFGSAVIAGYSASIKLNNLVITTLTTIGNGISNYTSQNIGAGKPSRIKPGFRAGVKLVMIICVPLVLLYFFGGRYLVQFFIENPSTEALDSGAQFLQIVSPLYIIGAIKLTADGVLRGAGKMGRFMSATFTDLSLRVILAIVLSGPFGSTGIWMAWPVGWTISAVMSYTFYRTLEHHKMPDSATNEATEDAVLS